MDICSLPGTAVIEPTGIPDQGNADLVSVIMPAFRMGGFIGGALDSIAAQTHEQWEVIVVDDHGPEDGTHAVVQAFRDKVANKVELIRHGTNQGVSAARNTGISASKGAFIAFLDPDDLWLPHHLRSLLDLVASKDGPDVATGPVEVFRHGPTKEYARVLHLQDWQVKYFPDSLALSNFIQPSATMVRREALIGSGGFDTAPAIQHIEDYDLWIRLAENGSKFSFLPRHTSRYRKHGSAATSDAHRMRQRHDDLMKKHAVFFQRAQVGMLSAMMRDQARLSRLETLTSGPIMRSIAFLDRSLQQFKARVAGSSGSQGGTK